MNLQGRKHSVPFARAFRLAFLAFWLGASGCVGPVAVKSTRSRYNEAMRITNDEQLLTNLVRLRYADSPVFIDLPNITSQFEMAALGNYNGGYGNQYLGPSSLGFGQLTLRDSPTLSYHPRQGREIAKALLNPISADFFTIVNAGARLEQFLWMTLNDINDVQNAVRATTLAPVVADDNQLFLQGVRLLSQIDDRGGAEIGFTTNDSDENASDSFPSGMVQGRDLIGAAKDGYVFRTQADGKVLLLKREKELTLKIRSAFTHSPEMLEMAKIFNIDPGLSRYKIKSELQPGAESTPPIDDDTAQDVTGLPSPLPSKKKARIPRPRDTIYLNLRSILQIMTFLSKGVCVPQQHVAEGIVPMTPGPDGLPYDWTRVTAGNFFIASQKHRPHNAEVAIQYRGYWFFIPRDDINSRSVLSVLEILFTLQDSDEKTAGPVLTLPAGS